MVRDTASTGLWRQFVLSLIVAATPAFLAACGGSSSSPAAAGQQTLFAPGNAAALSRAALLSAHDLTGDWTAVDGDYSDDLAMGSLSECKQTAALHAEELRVRAGRALRTLTQKTAGASLRISSLVQIYSSSSEANSYFQKEKALEDSDAGLRCQQEVLKAGAPSLSLAFSKSGPVTNAGAGARDSAQDTTVEVSGVKHVVHLETHEWVQGNAVLTVVVSGEKADVTLGIVNEAITKQHSAAADAAAGKRQP